MEHSNRLAVKVRDTARYSGSGLAIQHFEEKNGDILNFAARGGLLLPYSLLLNTTMNQADLKK
jgi:hypothetical protein